MAAGLPSHFGEKFVEAVVGVGVGDGEVFHLIAVIILSVDKGCGFVIMTIEKSSETLWLIEWRGFVIFLFLYIE